MNLKSEIPFDIPIKDIILQEGIAADAQNLCSGLGKRGLLVCDENTRDFVRLNAQKYIFPEFYKPELEKAVELSKIDTDYYVAVGSGSLNDMVKYASFLAGKPYVVFATAPSMNGYASANVSLITDGFKKSFLAIPPHAIYGDLEILNNAPRRLINSGIGDSICRSTCEADALLSNQVLGTSNYSDFFNLIKKYENNLFDNVESLFKSLIFGGLAMYLAKSSAPASQSEHMLAHYMELMQPDAPHSFHGEQISVTTVTMAKLQENLLDKETIIELPEDKIINHYGSEFGKYCIEQTAKKYSGIIGKKISADKKIFENKLLSAQKIQSKMTAIGAPINAAEIGWNEEIYKKAIIYAKYSRDRFTFLDLA